MVPWDEACVEFGMQRMPLLAVLRERLIVLLGLGVLGFSIGTTLITGFMVFYLERSLAVAGTIAGLVTSLVTVIPIFTSIWGGRVYDTVSKHRALMIVAMLGSAGSLAVAGMGSAYAAVASAVVGGVVSGFGFTFAFAGARDFNKSGKQYESLAISWVNSIQLTGEFFPPLFFSYVTVQLGYSQAWLWSAVLTLAFVVPVAMMVETWHR